MMGFIQLVNRNAEAMIDYAAGKGLVGGQGTLNQGDGLAQEHAIAGQYAFRIGFR